MLILLIILAVAGYFVWKKMSASKSNSAEQSERPSTKSNGAMPGSVSEVFDKIKNSDVLEKVSNATSGAVDKVSAAIADKKNASRVDLKVLGKVYPDADDKVVSKLKASYGDGLLPTSVVVVFSTKAVRIYEDNSAANKKFGLDFDESLLHNIPLDAITSVYKRKNLSGEYIFYIVTADAEHPIFLQSEPFMFFVKLSSVLKLEGSLYNVALAPDEKMVTIANGSFNSSACTIYLTDRRILVTKITGFSKISGSDKAEGTELIAELELSRVSIREVLGTYNADYIITYGSLTYTITFNKSVPQEFLALVPGAVGNKELLEKKKSHKKAGLKVVAVAASLLGASALGDDDDVDDDDDDEDIDDDNDVDEDMDVEAVDVDGDGDIDVVGADTDGDGYIDTAVADTDGDGYADIAIADTDGDGYADTAIADTDGDGYADIAIADTDGDGYADTAIADTDGDGYADTAIADTDGDGYADTVAMDTDGDGALDSIAVDSNGDGALDTIGVDENGDGNIDTVGYDLDADGSIDHVEAMPEPEMTAVDLDGDGDIDALGADYDGDGAIDTIGVDSDNDGQLDTIAVDRDGDGDIDAVGYDLDGDGSIDHVETAAEPEMTAVDLDGDGDIDALGADYDGDGAIDTIGVDSNNDGVLDTIAVDSNSDGVLDTVGYDFNGDGVLDRVDRVDR